MPWLLTLHIAALLCWCGTLLYLPGLMLSQTPGKPKSLSQWVYTAIATPAALASIILGTLVFSVHNMLDKWLIAKLFMVTLLVLLHLLLGWLIARHKRNALSHARRWCYTITLLLGALITAIIALVLAKPVFGV